MTSSGTTSIYWFNLMIPYPLKGDLDMVVACVTLYLFMRKVIYAGYLQWDIMRKVTKVWENSYVLVSLGMVNKIYSKDGNNFTETEFTAHGNWFGKLMRGSKLQIGVINNNDYIVTIKRIHAMLLGWYT